MSFRRGAICVAIVGAACGAETPPPATGLPSALPFEVARAPAGDPVPAEEVASFTRALTGFWRRSDYFRHVIRTSHGVDASTGQPEWAVWWQDVRATKTQDRVVFRHAPEDGGAHNVYIATSRVLANAAAGYLLTGDPAMGRLVELYARGVAAACRGFVHSEGDPLRWLMARNVVAQNHEYVVDGRRKAVDFTGWYSAYTAWNAQRFHYPSNPTWGDVWVTNMRSKDDVPHIYVAAIWMRYVMERGRDDAVRAAAAEADECVTGFARDIVESGYRIRTKDEAGQPFIPDQDLASFVQYESVIPNGECTSKITSAFLAQADALGNDCARADGADNAYEGFATDTHYYNYHIIRTFHVSAVLSALISRADAAAERMVKGLGYRADRYTDPAGKEPGLRSGRFAPETAVWLLEAAAAGMPLTGDDVRRVHRHYRAAIDAYASFERWDLWDPAVPDGEYSFRDGYHPSDLGTLVSIEDMAYALQYCASPFSNPSGERPVDCALIADPSTW